MLELLGLRGFPRGGRQLAHAADGPVAELGKDVQEVFAEIDIQAPAGFHDGSDGGDLRSGFRAANVQPVLASECQRSNRAFAPVMPPPDLCRVVKLEADIPAISNLIGDQRAA
jgi:hypothetical protein